MITSKPIRLPSVDALEESSQAMGWDIEYKQLRKGSFTCTSQSVDSDEASCVTEIYTNKLLVRSTPPSGCVAFFLPQLSEGSVKISGSELSLGDFILLTPGAEVDTVIDGKMKNQSVFMQKERFDEIMLRLIPNANYRSMDDAMMSQVYRAPTQKLQWLFESFERLRQSPEHNQEDFSNLLSSLILCFADSTQLVGHQKINRKAATYAVKKAVTYIDGHYHSTISMENLCSYVGIGVRTLQRYFLEQLDMTPLHYIRAKRMKSARHDLTKADPRQHTVTHIATKNGYSHLGRFAKEYKSFFGESPSQTLGQTPNG